MVVEFRSQEEIQLRRRNEDRGSTDKERSSLIKRRA